MNYNPSPKSEFVKNTLAVESHRSLVQNEALRHAMEITLSELHRRAAQHTDPTNFNACASSHLRLLGAQDFMDTFFNLAETAVAEARKDNTNLPTNVASLPRKN